MTKTYFKYVLMLLILMTVFVYRPLQLEQPVPYISNVRQFLADVKCLETNIYREAIGEPYVGQLAVGLVTLNRVKSDLFPKTVCKVVHQPYQFSWTMVDPSHIKVPAHIHELAVRLMLTKVPDLTNGALYFRRYDVAPPPKNALRIDNHIFY